MKEKILVTGGAGYIGSILVEELLRNKFDVTVLDNFTYSNLSLQVVSNFQPLPIPPHYRPNLLKILHL